MAKKISLKCEKRKVLGRQVKKLRREGILPANIYGKEIKSQAVQLTRIDFMKAYQEAGETSLVELEVGGKKPGLPVLIHSPQVDPVTGDFLHVDFHRVSLKEKVTTMIPVELVGKAPAAESGEGVLITILSELEVEALPTDLPDKFEVDISKLEKIDDAVRIKEIKVDKKKVAILANENQIVVKIEKPIEEEEVKPVEEEAPVEGEAPVEKEKKGEKRKVEGKPVAAETTEKAETRKEASKEEEPKK